MKTLGFLLLAACLLFSPSLVEGNTGEPSARIGVDGGLVGGPVPRAVHASLPSGSQASAPAGILLQYTLPVTPTDLLVDTAGVWYSSFNQGSVGFLDPANGFSRVYNVAPGASVFEIRQDGSGRIWYATANGAGGNDAVGMLDPVTGRATQWVVPRNHFGLRLDAGSSDVWFVSKGLPDAQLVRLNPGTNQATLWNVSPYTDTYDLDIAPGGAIWFTVEPRGLQGVGLLTPATGQATVWTMPSPDSRPFRILAAGADEIWLTEFGAPGNAISRLTPSTGELEQYPLPIADSGPGGFVKLDGRIWFAAYNSSSIGRLDLSPATPQITRLTSVTIQAAATSRLLNQTSFTPPVTKVAAPVKRFAANAGVYGPYTMFPLPQLNASPFDIATNDGGHTLWFTDGAAARIGKLLPAVASSIFLPVVVQLK